VSHDYSRIEVATQTQLRTWLVKHYEEAESTWLVTWKKGDPGYLPYAAIVEEALCFGWIDSLPRKLDAHRSMILLFPRRVELGRRPTKIVPRVLFAMGA
jgi:uncharacterized protein YdeI (YjbR/CyaY-like superfamily)